MSDDDLRPRWRDEPVTPDGCADVARVVRAARQARGRVVEFEWTFTRAELDELREAVYAWGSNVVGRYRCFDARMLSAINQALDDTNSLLVLSEPKNAPSMDCAPACTRSGELYRVWGHAPFDVIFGYGYSSARQDPGTQTPLGASVAAKLVKTVEQLGWNRSTLFDPDLLPVRNVLFGFPVGHGARDEPTVDKAPREVDARFEGPFAITSDNRAPCLFDDAHRELASRSGIYIWTLHVDGRHRPWYVGQTRQGFSVRIAQHVQALLSGQYEILDASKLAESPRFVVWRPSANGARWPASLPTFLADHARVVPAAVAMLRSSRFFLTTLDDDQHLLNCVEGAIGRYFQRTDDARRYFDTGMKLPARIPNDAPIRLTMASTEAIEGMPAEIREP